MMFSSQARTARPATTGRRRRVFFAPLNLSFSHCHPCGTFAQAVVLSPLVVSRVSEVSENPSATIIPSLAPGAVANTQDEKSLTSPIRLTAGRSISRRPQVGLAAEVPPSRTPPVVCRRSSTSHRRHGDCAPGHSRTFPADAGLRAGSCDHRATHRCPSARPNCSGTPQ